MRTVLFAIVTAGLLVIALVFEFPITHHLSSTIASLAFALITMLVIYQTFSKKIIKVTAHRRKKAVHAKDELWRSLINEEQMAVMANMSVEDQYQHCTKHVEAWQQMMNTIGNDSSMNSSHNSRSQNQNSHEKYSKNSNVSSHVEKGTTTNGFRTATGGASEKAPSAAP
jgi:hypothetical protein